MSIIKAETTYESVDLQDPEFLSFMLHVTLPVYNGLNSENLDLEELFLMDREPLYKSLKADGFDFQKAEGLHQEAFVSEDFTLIYQWVNDEISRIVTDRMIAEDEASDETYTPDPEWHERQKAGLLKALAEHKAQQQDRIQE